MEWHDVVHCPHTRPYLAELLWCLQTVCTSAIAVEIASVYVELRVMRLRALLAVHDHTVTPVVVNLPRFGTFCTCNDL